MAKKKQKKKKSSVRGIYFALIIWLICSESLPMYTLGGILGAAAITIAGAALLSRLFGGKKKEEDEDQYQYEIPYVDTQPRQTAPKTGAAGNRKRKEESMSLTATNNIQHILNFETTIL